MHIWTSLRIRFRDHSAFYSTRLYMKNIQISCEESNILCLQAETFPIQLIQYKTLDCNAIVAVVPHFQAVRWKYDAGTDENIWHTYFCLTSSTVVKSRIWCERASERVSVTMATSWALLCCGVVYPLVQYTKWEGEDNRGRTHSIKQFLFI